MKLLQDLITGIQNNTFSQNSVIQSVKIHNNLVFCTFCCLCPLPLLCYVSVRPLSMPLFCNVLQSARLSVTTTFEVHGKTWINFRQWRVLLPFWFRLWLLYGWYHSVNTKHISCFPEVSIADDHIPQLGHSTNNCPSVFDNFCFMSKSLQAFQYLL